MTVVKRTAVVSGAGGPCPFDGVTPIGESTTKCPVSLADDPTLILAVSFSDRCHVVRLRLVDLDDVWTGLAELCLSP